MTKLLSFFKNVLSFELFFILFLFAGRYKGDPRFGWVPVDLTALFFGLSIAGGIYILFKNGFFFRRPVLKLNGIYLVFIVYVLASYIWTPGDIYAREKMLFIATLTFWPLLATSLIISADYERLKRFLLIFVLFASWVAIEVFIAYQGSSNWKVESLGGNYLGIGRVVGPAAIIVLMYVLFYSKSLYEQMVGLAVFGFFLYVQLITGGRGPLLAALLPIFIPLFASVKFNASGRLNIKNSLPVLIILIGLTFGGALYMMNSQDTPTTLRRMNELVNEAGGGSSAQARLSFFETSLNLWTHKVFTGYGVGSWPVLVGFIDMQDYPHNIVLETLVEFGLIGFIILASLFVYAIRNLGSWKSIRNTPLKLIILMIFLNAFLNALLSGDIPNNRFVFGALGLMMADPDIYITSRFKRSMKVRT